MINNKWDYIYIGTYIVLVLSEKKICIQVDQCPCFKSSKGYINGLAAENLKITCTRYTNGTTNTKYLTQ